MLEGVGDVGGTIALSMFHRGAQEAEVRAQVLSIAATLEELFTEAALSGDSLLSAARHRVDKVLGRAPAPAFGARQALDIAVTVKKLTVLGKRPDDAILDCLPLRRLRKS